MTYKLWANGAEHGPYTRDEIQGQYERGELVGVLWRRVGQSQYQPHTELETELASLPPIPAEEIRRDPEPSGESTGGQIAIACGVLIFVLALAGALALPVSGAFTGVGILLIMLGYLAQIHAKLRLIAHRLRRE